MFSDIVSPQKHTPHVTPVFCKVTCVTELVVSKGCYKTTNKATPTALPTSYTTVRCISISTKKRYSPSSYMSNISSAKEHTNLLMTSSLIKSSAAATTTYARCGTSEHHWQSTLPRRLATALFHHNIISSQTSARCYMVQSARNVNRLCRWRRLFGARAVCC